MQIAQLNRRCGVFTTDDGACVEVVVACPIAERIELHVTACIAREGQGPALMEERLEAQLVLSGGLIRTKLGIHGNDLLLHYP